MNLPLTKENSRAAFAQCPDDIDIKEWLNSVLEAVLDYKRLSALANSE